MKKLMKYKNLNLKYALVNVGYMLLLCATGGYVYNFLSQSGFSDSLTGTIIALISVIGVFLQPWAGQFVDKSEKVTEKQFVSVTMLITAALSLVMAFLPKGQFLIIPILVIAFSSASVGMPLLNSMAFLYEKDGQKINYGLCRGIGSAAYAVGSKVVGMLWTQFGKGSYPFYIVVIAVLTYLAVSMMPDVAESLEQEKAAEDKAARSNVSYVEFFKRNKQVAVVCCALILLYFMHMICNTYIAKILGQFVETSKVETTQGTALFIAAMCELPTMFGFVFLMKKLSIVKIMKIAAIFYSVKHLLVFLSNNVTLFYFAMILQMFSYAALAPATVYYGGEYIAPEDRNKGQAILGMSLTIGGLLSSFLGGQLFNVMDVKNVLFIGLLASIAGTVIMVMFVKEGKKAE